MQKLLLQRTRKKLEKLRYQRMIERVFETIPISVPKNNLWVLTQIGKAYIPMYLVAIKSFLNHLGYGHPIILSDGTLDLDDERLLKSHLPDAVIECINDVDMANLPTGGTWERLVRILELKKDSYVIQLDSDTLTRGPLVHIDNAVRQNAAFCIGNHVWAEPVEREYMSHIAGTWQGGHVQVEAERQFGRMHSLSDTLYCRGSSGFSGFSIDSNVTRDTLVEFSNEMSSLIGNDKWTEWGSEQVSSNIIVSKSNAAHVLPWPLYQNYKYPPSDPKLSSFIHFIGPKRFTDSTYRQYSQAFITKLTQ